jgi:hypothetical protein
LANLSNPVASMEKDPICMLIMELEMFRKLLAGLLRSIFLPISFTLR